MSDPVQTAFLTHFSAPRDPRQWAKVLYPLPEILLLLLCATISGADDFVAHAEGPPAEKTRSATPILPTTSASR